MLTFISRVARSRIAHCDAADQSNASSSSPSGSVRLQGFATIIPGNFPDDAAPEPAAPTEAAGSEEEQLVAATAALAGEVEHLKALLKDRSEVDAEAWRMQRALQHQEEADAEKLMDLLRAHEEAFAATLEESKAEVEARVIYRMQEELAAVQAEHEAQLKQLSEAHAAQRQVGLDAAEADAQRRLEAALAAESAALQTAHEGLLLGERQAYGERLSKYHIDVDALAAAWSHDTRYKSTSHAVHQLSAAVLSLEESLAGRSSSSFEAHCKALPELAKRLNDPLLSEVSAALAPLSKKSVATMPQLQARFATAAEAGRVAALVPEKSGMWGHLLASVTHAVTLAAPRDLLPSEAARSEASVVFSRAGVHLDKGQLGAAVAEVRRLKGPPGAICAGWLEAAEERLLLEQTLTAVKAEASIAMAALC